jgi:hypothetical protein
MLQEVGIAHQGAPASRRLLPPAAPKLSEHLNSNVALATHDRRPALQRGYWTARKEMASRRDA